jgi:uncharacterized protein YkwD
MEVLDLVNAERREADLPELLWHQGAADVAFAHSVDMAVRGFFSHTNPDGLGPSERISAAGIPWSALGENIAQGQGTPTHVMSSWMGSSGHRANILNPTFTHLGVGVRTGSSGPWWTQNFLRP